MQTLIFDTHTHYASSAFDEDRRKILQNLPTQGVCLVIDCATDLATSKQCINLSEEYSYVYAAAGIHPQSLIEKDASTLMEFGGNWQEEMKAIAPLYAHPKVIAVGECGLDHHWPVPKDAQLALFEAEIRTALEQELPIIVHDRKAHEEVYALLKKYTPKGVLHAFSGSVEDALWLAKQGMYIGLGGTVTFKNARQPKEIAAALPIDMLLLETDCPYMTPEPYRGKRNHSGLVIHIATEIAKIRGASVEYILQKTLENGKRLFNIK